MSAMNRTDIILVEDDALVGEISRDVLMDAGYTVRLVQNSREAVAAIKAAMPKLVILDIMMPGISGLDICKTVKADPAIRHMKVIVMSGKTFNEVKMCAFRLGAAYFLQKPFDEKTLIKTVKAVMDSQHQYNEVI